MAAAELADGAANLDALIAESEGKPRDWNEANTRFHIIDRILRDCLGWPTEASQAISSSALRSMIGRSGRIDSSITGNPDSVCVVTRGTSGLRVTGSLMGECEVAIVHCIPRNCRPFYPEFGCENSEALWLHGRQMNVGYLR